ncbi:hypothetical protein [Flavobacterium sp.]
MMQPISNEKKQRILELYLCGNDKRLAFISAITGSNPTMVSKIVQEHFDGTLFFERGDCYIMHSSINYINNTELNKINTSVNLLHRLETK